MIVIVNSSRVRNMDENKPFTCEDCKKSFTLKWNLKAHAKSCKGCENKSILICENGMGNFAQREL